LRGRKRWGLHRVDKATVSLYPEVISGRETPFRRRAVTV
jgi:hypothetical protein